MDIPPIDWPQAKQIQTPRPVRKVFPANDFFAPPQAVPGTLDLESSTAPGTDNKESTVEAVLRNMPGMNKFNNLLAAVSRIPDGPLKDLHYAALEGVLQGALPVKDIQRLIPEAGKQFGEFYHDAEAGGKTGTMTLDALREFQKLLKGAFDMTMEMSDNGLYLSEGNSSAASAWIFVPTQGAVTSGANCVGGSESSGKDLEPEQALSRIRNKFSQALDFVAIAS